MSTMHFAIPVSDELHEDTASLIVGFATAMAEKLAAAQEKYGYTNGWKSPDWMDACRSHLIEHIKKGDPRDVAAYCAFLWYHGEPTYKPLAEDAKAEIKRWPNGKLRFSGHSAVDPEFAPPAPAPAAPPVQPGEKT